MSANNIRKQFLDYFERKGHKIVPSAPIVVKNDPTLMFTNAGMNQFKDWFLGNETPAYKRVANTQKCLRVSGKHNDLEEVGVDTYHHTMFEMLGNWSFGDYFKAEAIEWAWDLLTNIYHLPKDRLYVTVFEGDNKEGLDFDTESYNQWMRWVEPNRILKGNKKDNFWEMGDTGPCGPCTEIHIDLRSDEERNKIDGALLVNNDHPQLIEIWNNVFMEFNRKADGSLEKLPAQHVDTGMGFERLVRAIEGKSSNYDTDVFVPTIQFIEKESGIKYLHSDKKQDIAMRVVADHIRTIGFAIADGQLPANNGAGYVIRRILRRAVRYQYQFLHIKEPFLCKLVLLIADSFKNVFPELYAQHEFVEKVIREEEESFLRTLKHGIIKLEQEMASGSGLKEFAENSCSVSANKISDNTSNTTNGKVLSGSFVFELSDTYGFPVDLTQLIAREYGYDIDLAGYEIELQKQKERSRKATEIITEDWLQVNKDEPTLFVGYDTLEAEVSIVKCRKIKAKGKALYQLVLNQTPFYPEGGGQVGDTGMLIGANESIIIQNTVKENNLIIHFTDKLPENLNQPFKASVNANNRLAAQNNHTATHLLHAALRNILGAHVAQKGSLVNADYLRFDFSHFAALTDEELIRVELMVNRKIRENIKLHEERNMPIANAQQLGAMMLFGEKYGEKVRVITFDANYSIELCGGTHVKATGEIGYFKIVSESAVAAGIRRIEAITAVTAENYLNEQLLVLDKLKDLLKTRDITKSVQQLIDEKIGLQKRVNELESEKTLTIKKVLIESVQPKNNINVIAKIISIANAEQLKNLSFELKKDINNLVCVLGAEINGKPLLSIIISENLVQEKNIHAGNLVKQAAAHIQGGGGGQPFYATAGGNNVNGLQASVNAVLDLIFC